MLIAFKGQIKKAVNFLRGLGTYKQTGKNKKQKTCCPYESHFQMQHSQLEESVFEMGIKAAIA